MAFHPVREWLVPSRPALVAWGDAARDKPSPYRNDGPHRNGYDREN
ncbi:MAG: hypothetical protein QOF51_2445 [Chloroflexota bacterium]|nr:hypothetical protein [Chloroflexota bacterium]